MMQTVTPTAAGIAAAYPEAQTVVPSLADVTATVASARTALRDGRRGIEVTVEGIVRLHGAARATPVAAVVFCPAGLPDAEARAVLANELAAASSLALGLGGRVVPSDRISVHLG